MTQKIISTITAVTAIAGTDLFEIETAGGQSYYATAAQLATFMSGQMWAEPWSDGTINTSESRFSTTVCPVAQTVTGAAGKRLEFIAGVYNATGTATSVFVSPDGTNYYRWTLQADGNVSVGKNSGNIGALSINTGRLFTGVHHIRGSLMIHAASSNRLYGKVEHSRVPSQTTALFTDTANNMVATLTSYLETSDRTKCFFKYRLVG